MKAAERLRAALPRSPKPGLRLTITHSFIPGTFVGTLCARNSADPSTTANPGPPGRQPGGTIGVQRTQDSVMRPRPTGRGGGP